MAEAVSPAPPPRARLAWTLAVAIASVASVAAMEVRSRSARGAFDAAAGPQAPRVAVVADAADALRLWQAGGVRGRHLVVLTGQWSKPRGRGHGGSGQPSAPPPDERNPDAASALFFAWRLGVVRSFDVVMPPAAFTRRLGEVAGRKELTREDGAFRLRYDGVERRFATPRAFAPPAERVLVLVEPSWFADGASPEPLAWLATRGVAWDLAVIALADPAASGEERLAASTFARSTGAVRMEVAE